MNCRDAQERLDALADGELAPRETAAVEAHLAACTACTRERDLATRLRGAMGSAYPERVAVPAALGGLGARVRARAAAEDRAAAPARARLSWRARGGLLAAALLLVVAIPVVVFRRVDSQFESGAPGEQVPVESGAVPTPEDREAALALNQEANRLLGAGRRDEAVATLERIVREFPGTPTAPRAEFTLAALAAEDDPGRGADAFLALVAARPAHELADDALVEAALRLLERGAPGDAARALELLERVGREYGATDRAAEAAYRRGAALERTGDEKAATRAYRQAALLHPGTEWSDRAGSRVQELESR